VSFRQPGIFDPDRDVIKHLCVPRTIERVQREYALVGAAVAILVVTALLVYLGVVAGKRVRREVPLLLSAMLYRYRRRRSPKQLSADGGDERK